MKDRNGGQGEGGRERERERSTCLLLSIQLSDYNLTTHSPASKDGADAAHMGLAYLVIIFPFVN